MKKHYMVSCLIDGTRKNVIVQAERKSQAIRLAETAGLPAEIRKSAIELNKDYKTY